MRTISKCLVPPYESRVDSEDINIGEVPNGGIDDGIGVYLR